MFRCTLSRPSPGIVSLCLVAYCAPCLAGDPKDLSRQIADVMSQGPAGRAHMRFVHAKGIVCKGTFTAAPEAATVSRAAHFRGAGVPVTVRFSNGAPDIAVPDNSGDAAPRGIAIRFETASGATDVLGISRNGFIVGTPEDFLALQQAIAATDPSKPHPWPIETFLGAHPKAAGFVQDLQSIPASFANEIYFANNAFVFVNADGQRQAGRYQIISVDGRRHLDKAAAAEQSSNFLFDDLKARLSKAPVAFRLQLQLAEPGDPTHDASIIWPKERKVITLGTISIDFAVPDSGAAERKLAFDPTRLIDGIELSDDPLPQLRSRVYAISVAGRTAR